MSIDTQPGNRRGADGPTHAGHLVGVDIGGTFTDCSVIAPDGTVRTGKVPTRPDDRARSLFEAVEEAARQFGLSRRQLLERSERFVHGTTTGTNALITRTGATVGLLTTAGHGDVVHMMKARGRLVGLEPDQVLDIAEALKPEPLIPKSRVAEIVERVDFQGDIIVPLDEQSVRTGIARLLEQGVDAIAVSLLWSIRNPTHEQRVTEIVEEMAPSVFVSAASELTVRVGEYERTMTAVVNAYLGPLMRAYIDAVESGAQDHGYSGRVLYAQCAGGAITAAEARVAPIRTVHSGPVSGTLGSAFLAADMNEPNLIVTDMGGTSFDVSIVRELEPDVDDVSLLERFEIALPMVYLDTVGAGGGSIAWIDDAGGLQVGPQSAGADPGPACYGRGSAQATVTDADVVLGVLDPDNFLHGRMRLDRVAAESAVGAIAERLGLGLFEAAAGINRIIDGKMADLVRRMSVLRGLDPRDFVCFGYGGMGPAHICSVAQDVGVKQVIVPMLHAASVWSAFGAATARVSHVHQRWETLEMPADANEINRIFVDLAAQARAQLRAEGFDDDRIELQYSVYMRYRVQVYEVEVAMPVREHDHGDVARAATDFARLYDELHGKGAGHRESGAQITAFVVRSRGQTDEPSIAAVREAEVTWSSRPVYWEEYREFREVPVLRMSGGRLADELEGPMLIELPDTVAVIRPGQVARFDRLGSLVIDLT